MDQYHQPVLHQATIDLLDIQPKKIYVDATLGHAGHTISILKKEATVYGIDQDPTNLKIAQNRIDSLKLSKNFHPIHGNFAQLKKLLPNSLAKNISGILFDLGLSQNQQTGSRRGFSFNDQFSLDMRLDPKKQKVTAEMIINTADPTDLEYLFSKFSQEQYARPLVQKIVRARQKKPIKTGQQLADIIRLFYKTRHIKTRIDPATKIFMALRIAVNDEFNNLKSALSQSVELIKPGCPIAVISFHSGEDRIVKNFITNNHLCSLTKKPISPTLEEQKDNPLCRSAHLRGFTVL